MDSPSSSGTRQYITHFVEGNTFEIPTQYQNPTKVPKKFATPRLGFLPESFGSAFFDSKTRQQVEIKKFVNPLKNIICAKQILREIEILRQMDHVNVVALRDIILSQTNRFEDIYLVYEYRFADLYDVIMSRHILSDAASIGFMYDLLCGLKYIHSAKVIHCDLNPTTVILNKKFQLKIRDFGSALTSSEIRKHEFSHENQEYQPPEVILDSKYLGCAIDVWSVGCIFLELLTKKQLFPNTFGYNHLKLINELIGSPYDSDLWFVDQEVYKFLIRRISPRLKVPLRRKYPRLNTDAIDLIEKMLVYDPNKRITAQEALSHPCFATIRNVNKELICEPLLPLDSENILLGMHTVQHLIWKYTCDYNPGG